MDESLTSLSGAERRRRGRALAGLLLLGAALLPLRARFAAPSEEAAALQVVEVRGLVPRPGFYRLSAPVTAWAALEASGLSPALPLPDSALPAGVRLRFTGAAWSLEPIDEVVTLGLPVDVNNATAAALSRVPGLGAGLAEAIVADRVARGPFRDLDALDRVSGVGPATLAALRPHLSLGPDLEAQAQFKGSKGSF